jgi:hypothetical protein
MLIDGCQALNHLGGVIWENATVGKDLPLAAHLTKLLRRISKSCLFLYLPIFHSKNNGR